MEKFQKLSLVSVGPEFVYVSYAGLDPVAMLLAIGATAGEYAQMTPGKDQMDKLMMGGTIALYGYLSELPMLQGFNDLAKVFQSGANDGPTMAYDFMVALTKQAVSFGIGGSPLGVHQSFVAGIERVMDPSKSNIKPASWVRGPNNLCVFNAILPRKHSSSKVVLLNFLFNIDFIPFYLMGIYERYFKKSSP